MGVKNLLTNTKQILMPIYKKNITKFTFKDVLKKYNIILTYKKGDKSAAKVIKFKQ